MLKCFEVRNKLPAVAREVVLQADGGRSNQPTQSAYYSPPTTAPSQPDSGEACSQVTVKAQLFQAFTPVEHHHNITMARIIAAITPRSSSTTGAAPVEVSVTGVIEKGATCEVEAEIVGCELPPVELVFDTVALEEVAGLPPGTLTLAVTLKQFALVHT